MKTNLLDADFLISGTWLQVRDRRGGPDFTALLLEPVMLKDGEIRNTIAQISLWNPITSETFVCCTSQIVKILGRVQFPLPDRTAHLRIDPKFVKRTKGE